MCSIPLPSVTARHELTTGPLPRASQHGEIAAGQAFEGVPASIPILDSVGVVFAEKIYSHGKMFPEPITRFIHRGGKGLLRGRPNRSPRSLMSALIKPHGTKPYLRHIEAEICPPDEAGALSANDQGYPDRLDLSYTNGGDLRPGLLHRSRNDPEGAARR